jgi:hypothetical protein
LREPRRAFKRVHRCVQVVVGCPLHVVEFHCRNLSLSSSPLLCHAGGLCAAYAFARCSLYGRARINIKDNLQLDETAAP